MTKKAERLGRKKIMKNKDETIYRDLILLDDFLPFLQGRQLL